MQSHRYSRCPNSCGREAAGERGERRPCRQPRGVAAFCRWQLRCEVMDHRTVEQAVARLTVLSILESLIGRTGRLVRSQACQHCWPSVWLRRRLGGSAAYPVDDRSLVLVRGQDDGGQQEQPDSESHLQSCRKGERGNCAGIRRDVNGTLLKTAKPTRPAMPSSFLAWSRNGVGTHDRRSGRVRPPRRR